MDREKIIRGLETCRTRVHCKECPYAYDKRANDSYCEAVMHNDVLNLLKEQDKEIKALRLLVEWAEECDFGFDQFPDEYERYKDEIKDMKYIDGMIHVAKRTLEDHGEFEER